MVTATGTDKQEVRIQQQVQGHTEQRENTMKATGTDRATRIKAYSYSNIYRYTVASTEVITGSAQFSSVP